MDGKKNLPADSIQSYHFTRKTAFTVIFSILSLSHEWMSWLSLPKVMAQDMNCIFKSIDCGFLLNAFCSCKAKTTRKQALCEDAAACWNCCTRENRSEYAPSSLFVSFESILVYYRELLS